MHCIWGRITPLLFDVICFNSMWPSSVSTSPCMCDDVTSAPTPNTHLQKNFHTNRLGTRKWYYTAIACPVLPIYEINTTTKLGESPRQSWRNVKYVDPRVVLLLCTAFQWWHHGNRVLLLAERGIPKQRPAPLWFNSYPQTGHKITVN